jgi:hypothetical protein
MDRRNNPYAPGAGLQPPELAGRDRLIEDSTTDMDRLLAKRPVKGIMLLGLRGVGKTVLLNRLYGIAEEKRIHTGKIEAPEGGALPQLLVPELRRILYALDLQAAAGHQLRRAAGALRNFVRAFKVKAGDFEFGIEPSPGHRAVCGRSAILVAGRTCGSRGCLPRDCATKPTAHVYWRGSTTDRRARR